jgi:hypothetical protein
MKFALYLLAVVVLLGGLFFAFKPESRDVPSVAAPSTVAVNAPTLPDAPRSSTGAAPAVPPQNVGQPGPTAAAPAPTTTSPVPTTTSPTATTTPNPSSPQRFELIIRRGQLISGPTVIQVHKGDEVIIALTSDANDEVHLHGYDLHVRTRAGETTTLQFIARQTGRFGYELHHAKTELGALEVYPR